MPNSSDSMWSDYYEPSFDDIPSKYTYGFALIDNRPRPDQPLLDKLNPTVIAMLDDMAETNGEYRLWCRHGLLRAYFENETWIKLHIDMLNQ